VITLTVLSQTPLSTTEKLKTLNKLQRSPSIPVKLTSDLYNKLTTAPRNYHLYVVLTAMGPHQFDEELKLLTNAHSKNYEADKVYFAILDFKDGQEVFQNLGLNSAPFAQHFPPTEGKYFDKKRSIEPESYEFNRRGISAAEFAKFIEQTSGIKLVPVKPINYSKAIFVGGSFISVLILFKLFANSLWIFLSNKKLWSIFSIATIVLMSSGHMWNVIRNPPFVGNQFFAAGQQSQYIGETQVIGILYAVIAVLFVCLVTKVPEIKNVQVQRIASIILLINALSWSSPIATTNSIYFINGFLENSTQPLDETYSISLSSEKILQAKKALFENNDSSPSEAAFIDSNCHFHKLNNIIYCIGGREIIPTSTNSIPYKFSSNLISYHLKNLTVSVNKVNQYLSSARSNSVLINDTMYVFGGFASMINCNFCSNSNKVVSVNVDSLEVKVLENEISKPESRGVGCMLNLEETNAFLMISGLGQNVDEKGNVIAKYYNDVWKGKIENNTTQWVQINPKPDKLTGSVPSPLAGVSCTKVVSKNEQKIYFFGGRHPNQSNFSLTSTVKNNVLSNTMWILSVKDNSEFQWEMLQDDPKVRPSPRAAASLSNFGNGYLVLIGGFLDINNQFFNKEDNHIYLFDLCQNKWVSRINSSYDPLDSNSINCLEKIENNIDVVGFSSGSFLSYFLPVFVGIIVIIALLGIVLLYLKKKNNCRFEIKNLVKGKIETMTKSSLKYIKERNFERRESMNFADFNNFNEASSSCKNQFGSQDTLLAALEDSSKFEYVTAKTPYRPARLDEIELVVGDRVKVEKKFDDGWAVGFNMKSGLWGVFPLLNCQFGEVTENDSKNLDKSNFNVGSSTFD
ncbi:oligosaccharyl transferase subunit ost3/OST6, partial [Clydaea vesicula]